MSIEKIVARQAAYYANDAHAWARSEYADEYPEISELLDLDLPKKQKYAVCNLRGALVNQR